MDKDDVVREIVLALEGLLPLYRKGAQGVPEACERLFNVASAAGVHGDVVSSLSEDARGVY